MKVENFLQYKDDGLLVTGASGHSARYFFENLSAENYNKEIKCLVRKGSKVEHLKRYNLKLKLIEVDYNDVDDLKKSMKGSKTVLHTANITLSTNVIKAGAEVGIDWFICVHTTGRYSKFKSASAEYIEIEDRLINEHSNLTILRPTIIYGSSSDRNFWRLIKFINAYRFFPVFGSGKNLMQPVNADDLGSAYLKVLKNKSSCYGKQYNLSGRDQISYISILREIATGLDKKVFFVHLPMWLSLMGAYAGKIIMRSRFPITVEQVLRMKEDKIFSYENAKHDFGYTPMKFKHGILREVNELKLKLGG
jgi:nucleoside-diphosphate-sugar epimerase